MMINQSNFTEVTNLYRIGNAGVFNRMGKRLSCLKEGSIYSLYMDKTQSMDGRYNHKTYLIVNKRQRVVYRYDYEVSTGDVKKIKEFVDRLNGETRGSVHGMG